MIGFTLPSEEDHDDDAPTDDEGMASLAIERRAVSLDRVLAFYAAKHLLAGERPQASIEETAGLAAWLTGGPKADEDDEDEIEEGFNPIMLIDWFPPVRLLRRLLK